MTDLTSIVKLLADDPVSASRGDLGAPEDQPAYERAFIAIDADPAHLLLVAASGPVIVGTMQLTLLPGLARVGTTRMQVEAVRVRRDHRGNGIGGAMMRWAMEYAATAGAGVIQLTSDASRTDAHRFYERLGFAASHIGFKLVIPDAGGSEVHR